MLNLDFTTFPVLSTDRLVLRQLVPEYAVRLHELRSDPEINQYLDRASSANVSDALSFISKIDNTIASRQGMYWVITLAGDNNLIGTICVWNYDAVNDTVEIGYELMTDQQGKGIMAEAVSKVIDFCFTKMNARTITACPSADNTRSVKLLKKFNFVINDRLQTAIQNGATDMPTYSLQRGY